MRRFVIGDIHGAYKALIQVMEKSNFNYDSDTLICLGDVADSWSQVPECFDELLKVKNLIYIMGNHDTWLYNWFQTQYTPHLWLSQGGKATLDAYARLNLNSEFDRVQRHHELLKSAVYHYIDHDNNLFVHGGYDWHKPLEESDNQDKTWDRHLWYTATYWQRLHEKGQYLNTIKEFNEVFIGHTTTINEFPDMKPVHQSNVWNLDQGAGCGGTLTLMNVDTKEYFQSDNVELLYPDEVSR